MLPNVWTEPFNREIINELKLEAAKRFRRFQLPQSAEEWKKKRCRLLDALKRKLNIQVDHRLELDCRWSSPLRFDGYTLKEVCYQSRKDFYVTASLYVPDGKGPFPGIVGMHGHLSDGRLAEKSQGIAIRLAKSGYAVLFVDAFGSGERAAVHGEFEYHGGMVGGNLLNIGEPLLGIQVIDNMRAVDLLCSLPFVDGERIGATGSSGGGNQTMYLAAFDERVKAAVPVVSVGSYQSYVGGTNCICELIPDGLTICEESSLLALAAPNALMICNALHDINHTFHVSEAARSYTEAQKVYTALGVPEKISALAFNAPHAYPPELQGAVIGFFDFFLKGKGHGLRVVPPAAEVIPREKVMFFRKGRRSAEVCSIPEYLARRGAELKESAKGTLSGLAEILRVEKEAIRDAVYLSEENGWEKYTVETTRGRLLPFLFRKGTGKACRILAAPKGKSELEETGIIREAEKSDDSILVFDPWGCGECGYIQEIQNIWIEQHQLSRALLWLGRRLMGEWTMDYLRAVEFAVKMPGGSDGEVLLPIDSKFPYTLYSDMLAAYSQNDFTLYETKQKELVQRIRGMAKDIKEKYVCPPYTTNFAIMFLPIEGLYAEVVKLGLVEELQQKYSVTVAGPTTMAALLNSLQMGFQTLAIQKKSNEVWSILGSVRTEFEKFNEIIEQVRKRISLADRDLEELVGVRSRAIAKRLKNVATEENVELMSPDFSKDE